MNHNLNYDLVLFVIIVDLHASKDICRIIFINAMSFVKIQDLIGFVSECMLIST